MTIMQKVIWLIATLGNFSAGLFLPTKPKYLESHHIPINISFHNYWFL